MTQRIAIVGIGAMGSRIARRIIDAGNSVVVWNRTADKAAPLVEAGARLAATPADAAEGADAVITMVSDPSALTDVVGGPDGITHGIHRGATLIEMSTVGPDAIARLPSLLPSGVDVLDAPVLGSVAEAEAGALRIFVGGSSEAFERWTPLLSGLGTPMHVGGPGSGAAAKLVANATLFGVIGVLGEALALAGGLGLPDDIAYAVLSATPVAAQAERRRPSIEAGIYPPRFTLSLARKDADLVVDAARAAGVDLRIAVAARSWLLDAERSDLGDLDYSAVLARILARSRSASAGLTEDRTGE